MRKWTGIICVFLGVICLLSAIGFAAYNRWEGKNAEVLSQNLLADIQSKIAAPQPESALPDDPVPLPDDSVSTPDAPVSLPDDPVNLSDVPEKSPAEMATVEVGGYDCIGILSVPVLDLELPVLTDWSYAKLQEAPCHYYGTYYEKDFVIAAHNYASHFGRLSQLQSGDLIIFTDVNGAAHCYEVVLLETLPKEATEAMITSGFALSLYTCTPGGASRVTVRCNAITP